MQNNRPQISAFEVRRASAASTNRASAPTNSTQQLNDDELIAHFEGLAPPPELMAKQRLEKMIPSLVKARRNGNSIQTLASILKTNGIDVSHVTLRKRLDDYEKATTPQRGASSDTDVDETIV